jgi:hypothetical protein
VDAGFIAGTPVWTDGAAVPIEQLQVGDLVLSQHAGTGERSLKRVLQTFRDERQEVVKVTYWAGEEAQELIVTPRQPVWLQEGRWKAIGDLEEGEALLLASAQPGWGWEVCDVYRSAQEPGTYWFYNRDKQESWRSDPLPGEVAIRPIPGLSKDLYMVVEDPCFRFAVHAIEVEGFHTYFAGKSGLFVHDRGAARGGMPDSP